MTSLVIFELDKTLCDHDAALARARSRIDFILRESGIPTHEFWQVFSEVAPTAQSAMIEGFLSGGECLQHAFAQTCSRFFNCVGVIPETLARIYQEDTVYRIQLFHKAKDTLTALRSAGVTVAIFAEGDSLSQREKFHALGLQNLVEPRHFFVSEETGCESLSTLLLQHILLQTHRAAHDAVVVTNPIGATAQAAQELGIRCVLMDEITTIIHQEFEPETPDNTIPFSCYSNTNRMSPESFVVTVSE